MTAMVERMARAIATSRFGHDGWDDDDDGSQYWERCVEDARAAIEAMREPTESMLAATEKVVVGYDDFATGDGTLFLSHPGFHDNAKTAWRVMLDAALEQRG